MAGEIRFQVPKNSQARWTQFERDADALSHIQAQQFQNEVADYIRAHIGWQSGIWADKRKADSTGRLEQVTRNKSNRYVRKTNWRVGVPSYLNRSSAKYWRTIEQGTIAVWARPFKGTILKFSFEGFNKGRPKPGRNFRSFPGHIPDASYRGQVVKVTKEVYAMNAYENVFNEHGWRQKVNKDFRQIVTKNF